MGGKEIGEVKSIDMKMPGKIFSQDELENMARTELNEDPKLMENDLKLIKEWIKQQPHLAETAKQSKIYKYCKFSDPPAPNLSVSAHFCFRAPQVPL